MADDIHRSILVIKLGALGDMVLALGPFAAIRKHHPEAKIILLTTPPYISFLSLSDYFDEIWADTRPTIWRFSEWWKLIGRLKAGGFSRIYDLQTSDRTGWYYRLMCLRGGYEWSGIVLGCSHRHTNPKRDFMHSIDRQKEQLAVAGIKTVPDPDLSWVSSSLDKFLLKSRYVLLVPGTAAHRLAKRWPAIRFASLAQSLVAQGIQPVIIGGSPEMLIGKQITNVCSSVLDLTGKTELEDIVALAHHAAVAVGNDTGPIHMIAAAGCPTIVLFSDDSNPVLTAPRGPLVEVIKRNNLKNLETEAVAAALRLR